MPSSKHHKRYRKSSSSSSEEPQLLRKCHSSPEKVYCKAISETLDFSATIGNIVIPAPQAGQEKSIKGCTPQFLNDGLTFNSITGKYGPPGLEATITGNTAAAFGLEQITTADCSCVHVAWHLQYGVLTACESYTITIARVNLCGAVGATIEPVATVAIPNTGGLDLCGRRTSQTAQLVGEQTVVGKFKKGELVCAYFTIVEPSCPPLVPCIDPCPEPPALLDHVGPGNVTLNVVLA